jgi:hypothetical protein
MDIIIIIIIIYATAKFLGANPSYSI